MELDAKTKLKKVFSKKTIIIAAIVLVVVIALVAIFKSKAVQSKLFGSKPVTQRTAVVRTGEINVTVTGSGPLTYSQSSNAATEVAGKITKLYFKEGDKVKAGDLIAEIDNKNAVQSVQDKQNTLEQAEVSNQVNNVNSGDLLVTAPFTGQVSNILVSNGAAIQKGAPVLTVTDTSLLKLMIPFNAGDASKISVGQSADVYLTALMQSVQGRVAYINNQFDTTSSGGKVVQVEIDMSNPGGLLGGMTASADINTSSGTVSSVLTGSLDYINKQVVYANASGTVGQILVKNGQKVSSGTELVSLQNNSALSSNQLGALKVQSAQSQLDLAQQTLQDYKIYASIDGAITSQTLNVGDNVSIGETIATIESTNQIQFDAPIDELDVPKLAVGQKVNVTIDALPETSTTPLQGVVSMIPYSGTATNGVATFNVTIQILNPSDKLRSGMNANAEIEVQDKQDVLEVPIEAVTKMRGKSFVWVKSNKKTTTNNSSWNGNGSTNNSGSSSQSGRGGASRFNNPYYANAVLTPITVGINNNNYIEVTNGLNEGDVIILPQLQTSQNSSNSQSSQGNRQGGSGMSFGGFGGGGGGGYGGGGNRNGGGSGNGGNGGNSGGNGGNGGNNGNGGANSNSGSNGGGQH